MRHSSRATAAAAIAVAVNGTSLTEVCNVSNVQAALPANGTLLGLDLLPGTVTASAVYNATLGGGGMMGGATSTTDAVTYSYCNVTVSKPQGTNCM
jgi:tannase